MMWTGQMRAARSRARAGRKFQRKLKPQNGALKPYLLPKVGTHDGKVVFCETSYYFMLKVIAGSGNRIAVTFLVRRTALLDGFFQTIVEIFVFPAFGDLCLIVEFDLVDEKTGKTLGLPVNVLILGRGRGSERSFRRCLGRGLGMGVTDGQRFGEGRVHFNSCRL